MLDLSLEVISFLFVLYSVGVCFPVSAHAYFLLLFIPFVFSIKSIEWIGPTIYDAAFPCFSYLFVRPSVECWVSDLIFKICSLYYADPEAEIENKYSKNWVDYFWLIEFEMLKKYCYRTLKSGDERWTFRFSLGQLGSYLTQITKSLMNKG